MRAAEKRFDEFCAKYGNEVGTAFLEKLADMQWSHVMQMDGITISDIHQHNACNHTLSGILTHDGIEYGFIISSGDWNGTDIEEFGLADDVGTYEPPKPMLYTFVPRDQMLKWDRPGMWQVFLAWRKEPWFKDKERGYNYDRHFAPGGKTESHYRDWAATKGLRIVSEEEARRIIDQPESERPIPLEQFEAMLTERSKTNAE